jgi:hypothetical protein
MRSCSLRRWKRHYARRLIMCGESGGARAGREVLPVLGGIIVVSEVVEECEQPIRRTVAAGFNLAGNGAIRARARSLIDMSAWR